MLNGDVRSFGLSEDGRSKPIVGKLPNRTVQGLKAQLPQKPSNEAKVQGITVKCYPLTEDHSPYTYLALLSNGQSEVGVMFYKWEEYEYFLKNPDSLIKHLG